MNILKIVNRDPCSITGFSRIGERRGNFENEAF